jgi:hypothetical protein
MSRPREPEANLFMRIVRALGQIWGAPLVDPASDIPGTTQIVEKRYDDLLEIESDPRTTSEMLTRMEMVQALNAPPPLPPLIEPPKPEPNPDELHDLGHRIRRTMLAKYPECRRRSGHGCTIVARAHDSE